MIRIFAAATFALAIAAGAAGAAAWAADPPPPSADDSTLQCKYVVAATPGSKPYRMCMSKGDWALKEARDAEDANRTVCHYQEKPGTKVGGLKICQPASAWAEDERLTREQIEAVQMKVCVPGAGC